jgi:hypothetical protein
MRGAARSLYTTHHAQHTNRHMTPRPPPAQPCARPQHSSTYRTIPPHTPLSSPHEHALENLACGALRVASPSHHAQHTVHTPAHHFPPPAHPCARYQHSSTHRTIPPRVPMSSPHAKALENHASGALRTACASHHAQHTVHAPAHHKAVHISHRGPAFYRKLPPRVHRLPKMHTSRHFR